MGPTSNTSSQTPAGSAGIDRLFEELTSFLVGLRDAGYGVGTQQFLAVQDLLVALAARDGLADAGRLRSLIGPIVCKNPSQQNDFAARFDRWAAGRPAQASPPADDAVARVARDVHRLSAPLRRWRLSLAVVAVLVIGATLWAVFRPGGHPRPKSSPAPSHVALADGKPATEPRPASATAPAPPTAPDVPAAGAAGATVGTVPGGGGAWRWRALTSIVWAAGSLLSVGAAYTLWWELQARRFLRRGGAEDAAAPASLVVDDPGVGLFRDRATADAALRLGRRRWQEGADLDVEATVEAYARTGTFAAVPASRRLLPEYLFLVDRATGKDQQARLIEQLVRQLRRQGLLIERYWFQGDPRTCTGEAGRGRLHRLDDLAAAFPNHRLVLCGDGAGLIDSVSGAPVPWAQRLEAWPERVLLTPDSPDSWGQREAALAAAGFVPVPATAAGLLALAHRLGDSGERPSLPPAGAPPLPEPLIDHPRQWTAGHPPPDAEVERVLAGLRAALGDGGYYWLGACAAYPELQWGLTLHFGARLRDDEGRPLLTEPALLRLVRLPWFREGWMPNWLRDRLIRGLSREREQAVRRALEALLLSAVREPAGGIVLEIAADDRSALSALTRRVMRWLQRCSPPHAPVREQVFASFMADSLRVRLPKAIIPLLRQFIRPSAVSAGGVAAVLAVVLTLVVFKLMLATPGGSVPIPRSETTATQGRGVAVGRTPTTQLQTTRPTTEGVVVNPAVERERAYEAWVAGFTAPKVRSAVLLKVWQDARDRQLKDRTEPDEAVRVMLDDLRSDLEALERDLTAADRGQTPEDRAAAQRENLYRKAAYTVSADASAADPGALVWVTLRVDYESWLREQADARRRRLTPDRDAE